MTVNTDTLVPMTDANQNFSRLAKLVERNGKAYIFKNNKPRFMMLDINNPEAIDATCKELANVSGQKSRKKGAK